MSKELSYLIKIFFLFVCLIYGFMPVENVPFLTADQFHFFFLSLIIVYVLHLSSYRFNKYGLIFFVFFMFIALINTFVSIGHDIVLFVQAVLFASIVGPAICNNIIFRKQFLTALRWLIVFSVAMLFLQYFVYNFFGHLLLIHEIVFPFSQARIADEGLYYSNIIRMGGLYIEPGTHSNFLYVYTLIYIVLKKNLKDPLLFFVAVSMILTYSAWGIMVASYLLILLILINLKYMSSGKKVVFFISIFFIIFWSVNYLENNPVVNFMSDKLERNSGSTGHKKGAYEKFQKEFYELIFIGQGFIPEFKKNISSLQDSGILLNLAIVFGALFTFLLAIVYLSFLWKSTNLFIVLISLPLFFAKMYYWDAAFLLLLFIVFYQGISNKQVIKFSKYNC